MNSELLNFLSFLILGHAFSFGLGKPVCVCCSLASFLTDCGGAPFLPLLFVVVNMAFNISLLNLVKMSSALVASLTATSAGPLLFFAP